MHKAVNCTNFRKLHNSIQPYYIIQLGENIEYNVLDNDLLPPGQQFFIELIGDSPCFFVKKNEMEGF